MAAEGSKLAVGAAIVGNTVVMLAKFVAFVFTGSSAMLSEAIHTCADVLNQILLMVGIVRSSRDADDRFHYGYGRERYIWALMSAVGIFFLGCGVTIYHGIQGFIHPHKPSQLGWAIGVLLFALIVEGAVLVLAWKGLWAKKNNKPFLTYLKEEADPAEVAVLLEDAAACAGVLIALSGIGLAIFTGEPRWDAAGSIVIGVLLGLVAIWLIIRNTFLLRGPAIPKEAEAKIRKILAETPIVEEVVSFKSRMIDLSSWDIMANIEFEGAALADQLEPSLREQWDKLETYEDFLQFLRKYADDIVELLGDKIDELEANIRAAVPEAKHLDLEAE